MAQATTFRSFGAGTPSFDTASEALGYFHSVPLCGGGKDFCSKARAGTWPAKVTPALASVSVFHLAVANDKVSSQFVN
jgi:hypothetical protein